jgi:cytochrome P450
MVDFIINEPNSETSDTVNGLRGIAMNVLRQTAYGQPKPWNRMDLPRDPKATISYTDRISLCTELLILAALVPVNLLSLPIMPKLVRTLGSALERLPLLTKEMLDRERVEMASGSKSHDNIMSMLVRLSDQGKNQAIGKPTSKAQYLTEDEICGNLFIFTAAGFDTTANTMSYTIALLAAHPEWQEWLREELDFVLREGDISDDLDYNTIFPRLGRCLAIMVRTIAMIEMDPETIQILTHRQISLKPSACSHHSFISPAASTRPR